MLLTWPTTEHVTWTRLTCDHLIGHFDEEWRHSLRGVVELADGVDHPDCIDQSWDCIHHWDLNKQHST